MPNSTTDGRSGSDSKERNDKRMRYFPWQITQHETPVGVRFHGSKWKSLETNLDHSTEHEDIPNGALCVLDIAQ